MPNIASMFKSVSFTEVSLVKETHTTKPRFKVLRNEVHVWTGRVKKKKKRMITNRWLMDEL